MFRRILVPLDGSSFGDQAVPTALAISRRTGGSVTFVHIDVPSVSSTHVRGVPIYEPSMDEPAERVRHDAVERVASLVAAETSVQPAVLFFRGPLVDTLMQAVDSCTADLIVMSTHGHGGPSHTWLGSLTDRLIRACPAPLLLVRPGADGSLVQEPEYKRMLVPCDGSALSEQVLPAATSLAKLFDMELTLTRVVSGLLVAPDPTHGVGKRDADQDLLRKTAEAESYLSELAERMRESGLTVHTEVIANAHAAPAILDRGRTGQADLIALTTHGRGGIRKLLLGSVADKLVRSAECGLLIHRPS
jgi:nucleotide-binding universal stress UspA family protein